MWYILLLYSLAHKPMMGEQKQQQRSINYTSLGETHCTTVGTIWTDRVLSDEDFNQALTSVQPAT